MNLSTASVKLLYLIFIEVVSTVSMTCALSAARSFAKLRSLEEKRCRVCSIRVSGDLLPCHPDAPTTQIPDQFTQLRSHPPFLPSLHVASPIMALLPTLARTLERKGCPRVAAPLILSSSLAMTAGSIPK